MEVGPTDTIEHLQATLERRTRERMREREATSITSALRDTDPSVLSGATGLNVYCVAYDLNDCWTINKLQN